MVADPLAKEDHVPHFTGVERHVAVRGGGYFPVLALLPDGSLGAVVRGGAGHVGRAGRLDWIRSTDGGKTWSAPSVIVNSEWDDRNPALGVLPDGTVAVAYAEASTYNERGEFDRNAGTYTAKIVFSPDQGTTWSKPVALDPQPIPNASPFGRIIVRRDGTALMSLYQYPSERACVAHSQDGGRTWKYLSELPGHDETDLLETSAGRVLAFIRAERSKTHGLELAESHDGGYTWSQPVRLLKPQQWPFAACQLRSGRLLLTYGNRTGPFGVGAVVSDDGGKTWDYDHRVLLAWDAENTDCGYPSTVQLADGTIVTMYYSVGTHERPDEELALVVRYRDFHRTQAK